uniref:Probable 2-oxoglutarate/Fe(II)-dependent dioxygenase n=1 Tax=Nicotiana tabacum TaxID=4097 RepID=A0A1S4BV43_TOBAC|nr:PREDICTED: probable 2-oxoglutarate/Fe(II)-dependent dioxygenase [Nicotiana tabacum]
MTSPIQLANVKKLAESPDLFIPSNYVHSTINSGDSSATDLDDAISLPIVDFSLLISGDPHQRAKALHDLSNACRDWGFFMVVNHGIAENLIKAVIDVHTVKTG